MPAGQAQKEVTHNEALALIDLALAATVTGAGGDIPPSAPGPGECWLVGPTPQGAWTGRAHDLAGWTGGGWRFVALPPGSTVRDAATGAIWHRSSTGWQGATAIAAPAGGAVADNECRATVATLIAALAEQGLIATHE